LWEYSNVRIEICQQTEKAAGAASGVFSKGDETQAIEFVPDLEFLA
jgi:hypothetical protein